MDKFARQNKVQHYPEFWGVNMTEIWEEVYRSYMGRSHGRMTMNLSRMVETRLIM